MKLFHPRSALVATFLACDVFSVAVRAQETIVVDSDTVLTVACSPDGRLLAGAGFANAVKIWDARTGELLRSLEGPARTTRRSIVFSPDGQRLLGAGDDGVVRVWHAWTGKL